MLTFREVGEVPAGYFEKYYRQTDVHSCVTSLVCKRIWNIRAQFAESNGYLILKNETEFAGTVFDFPRGEADAEKDLDAAFDALDEFCVKTYTRPRFFAVTTEEGAYLVRRYPRVTLDDDRNYRDYVYDREQISAFAGKKYAGQRNHIHSFEKQYPHHEYRAVEEKDRAAVFRFLDAWKERELIKKDGAAKREFALVTAFLREADWNALRMGCVTVDGEIRAISVGEKIDDQVIVHVEKALHEYDGIGVYMVREFAKRQTDVTWLNREDDAGERGLRTSKTQYHPAKLLRESFVTVRNELDGLKRVPTIRTERLVLNAIRNADAERYYRLCADEERNKYWGYDYKKDLQDATTTPDWFLQGVKRDFKARMCLNFAIRKEGVLIGETVVYELDYKGECQIGVRILPEYDGNGYGTEAFEATIRYALYGLGMLCVRSSCYKANAPSVKMHAKLFSRCGEDGEKYYYRRLY